MLSPRFRIAITVTAIVFITALEPPISPEAADRLQPGAQVWLHAHNCYPEKR